jgi:putative transposase
MKGKTYSTEEIIWILRQADGGETAQSVCRKHNISAQTFYRWKKKYGDMELADAKRLKELEKENAELKKMYTLFRPSGRSSLKEGRVKAHTRLQRGRSGAHMA